MHSELLQQSMGQIAQTIPGATAVMHRHKLDFCCGGGHSLQEALAKKGLPAESIVAELERLRDLPSAAQPRSAQATDALIEHILTRFHDVHREQLPELIRLAQRVERVHAGHPECPAGLWNHLQAMQNELEAHMDKEEEILFPMLVRGLGAMAVNPIGVMRGEHDDHGKALARLEDLTHGLQLPEGACNTWRALYLGLQTFKTDLMEHIHLENNVLFERFDGLMGGAGQN